MRCKKLWITVFAGSNFEDPDDLAVIAENELLGAANSIDAAAKKLEKLRPRKSIKVRMQCIAVIMFLL